MSATPLLGTDIAVLVESQYIPGDIRAYQHHFGALDVQGEDSFDQVERPPAAPWATTHLPHVRRATTAMRLFATAMAASRLIKGALWDGLWNLTPRPKLLKGHRVICH